MVQKNIKIVGSQNGLLIHLINSRPFFFILSFIFSAKYLWAQLIFFFLNHLKYALFKLLK